MAETPNDPGKELKLRLSITCNFHLFARMQKINPLLWAIFQTDISSLISLKEEENILASDLFSIKKR